ncbi:unnamed protein product [Prorocentrum cordatum]|uniref:Secreted protein n=1 Tax=Prorocentrum cordatum TaxID=2364126 RepID=A0ABN9UD19_9DINO|nr:unnamed protein product [Polarella glacialis]
MMLLFLAARLPNGESAESGPAGRPIWRSSVCPTSSRCRRPSMCVSVVMFPNFLAIHVCQIVDWPLRLLFPTCSTVALLIMLPSSGGTWHCTQWRSQEFGFHWPLRRS